jgi:very-short-patch-repair endonuclease
MLHRPGLYVLWECIMLSEKLVAKIEQDYIARMTEFLDAAIGVWCSQAAESCESPIEELFYVALMSFVDVDRCVGSSYGGEYRVCVWPRDTARPLMTPGYDLVCAHIKGRNDGLPHGSTLFIAPQAQVGNYRADFLIVRADSWGLGWIIRSIVVECDGRDFHDATAEQLRRDRARDRVFLENGMRVARFTGAELYRNPGRCVDQVFAILEADDSRWTPHPKEAP